MPFSPPIRVILDPLPYATFTSTSSVTITSSPHAIAIFLPADQHFEDANRRGMNHHYTNILSMCTLLRRNNHTPVFGIKRAY